MSKHYSNNPPAFPRPYSEQRHDVAEVIERGHMQEGMTLRDYFAAKALARVDRETWLAMCRDCNSAQRTPEQECAAHCYEIADAMLAERTK